jgi:hypothetical protein
MGGGPAPVKPPPVAPDLATVVAAWDELPEAIRAGIVAIVEGASAGTK